jgi:hypothetical protein
MEIYGTKEANLDFNEVESSSKDENIKLALVHYSLQPLLKRVEKTIEFTHGPSDSNHNSNDEKESLSPLMALKLIGKGQANVLDNHVGDVLKEPEEVSNQSSSSKLQKSQDDKKQLIVREPNPFYPPCVGISTRRTKKLKVIILKSKKFGKKSSK